MHKFEKLMEKMKDGKKMPEHEKDAKMSVLEHVRQLAQDMMKDKLDHGMKKVEIASDSSEGLKKGLEKAMEMMPEGESEDSAEPSEGEGSEEDEASEDMTASEDQDEDSLGHAAGHAEEEAGERRQDGPSEEEDEAELDRQLAALMEKKKKLEAARKA